MAHQFDDFDTQIQSDELIPAQYEDDGEPDWDEWMDFLSGKYNYREKQEALDEWQRLLIDIGGEG